MWHSKTYPNQAALRAERLEAEFRKLVAADGPAMHNAGLFIFYPERSAEATVYFSPETAALARQVAAAPCARPELRNGMGLYAGQGNPTQAHYPEKFPPART